jgi:hypothetical protein
MRRRYALSSRAVKPPHSLRVLEVAIESSVPTLLCHYFERSHGPFRNLSDVPVDDAERILAGLRDRGTSFAARRAPDYLLVRRELEERVRSLFIAKGGKPERARPHYLTLGQCPWLLEWYEDGCELCLPLAQFDPHLVSFTYGDTFPAMRIQDDRPYRQQVYTVGELPGLIARYGLPQSCNRDGANGPERYIEAQLWQEIA